MTPVPTFAAKQGQASHMEQGLSNEKDGGGESRSRLCNTTNAIKAQQGHPSPIKDHGHFVPFFFLPTAFIANQGQQPPQLRTIRKRAQQTTVPSAGERADDGSVAAPQLVGSMEGVCPAPYQPPSATPASQTPSLPAFPPAFSCHHPRKHALEAPA